MTFSYAAKIMTLVQFQNYIFAKLPKASQELTAATAPAPAVYITNSGRIRFFCFSNVSIILQGN